jgi:hypothetical protein
LLCEFLCKCPLLKLTLTVLRAVDQFTMFIPTTAQQQKDKSIRFVVVKLMLL